MFLFASTISANGQSVVNSPAEPSDPSVNSPVPLIVKFSSSIREINGTISSGQRSITFGLYKEQSGGSPIWSEMHTVALDDQGHFSVLLGSANTTGVPAAAFVAGEPRWIGVTPDDGMERPRLKLVSVPYALKAADSETLGGKRPEEFVSLQQLNSLLSSHKLPTPLPGPSFPMPPVPWPPITFPVHGRAPSFDATAPVGPSFISDATTGPPLQVASPELVPNLNADLLHGLSDSAFAKVGQSNVFSRQQTHLGGIDLAANTPEANTPGAVDSAPLDFESSTNAQGNAMNKQRFRWASRPILPPATGLFARLSLSFEADGSNPSDTGLSINSDGTVNFAPGQQLPSSAVLAALSGGTDASRGTTNPIVNTVQYSWNQTPPHSVAIRAGSNTLTLTPCPKGVNGTDAWHYLYLSGTGTPEVVLITGGTCTSRAASGTIEFAASYAHPAGYRIGSATDGVQEAVIDAGVPSTGDQISRQVLIDPGVHLLRARVSVRSSSITITSSGATLTCAMSDTCLMLGDPTNGDAFQAIVLQGLRLAPGVKGGTWPAVEDNAQGSQINDFGPAKSPVQGSSFGAMVWVDNDQASVIDKFDVTLNYSWGRCDATFCSTAIVGPGPFSKNAGILWIKNSNISLQCSGNGIDNQNANALHVSDSVVQGYPQFGIRGTSIYGNNPSVQLDSVHFEIGNCVNPRGTGIAGLIVEGGYANVNASVGPDGRLPVFANTGTTQYNYSIVAHSSTMGTSPAYLAGYANTNGAGTIPVLWNQIGNTGIVTYDLLRTTGASATAPFGTGAFAVATGIPATGCVNALCSFIDDAATQPTLYTVSTNTTYWPALKMWPGSVILTTASDYQNTGGGTPTFYFTDNLNSGAGIVASAGGFEPSVFAQVCNPATPMSSIWVQCLGGNAVSNDNPAVTATILQVSGAGGNAGGLKGRTIFELPPNSSIGPTEVVTLADSNPAKTMAAPNKRPSWDSNDTYIGYDQPQADANHIQLSFGAPVSISHYIANNGDNLSWGERLTKSAKTFQVPVYAKSDVTVDGTLHVNGSCQGGGCGPFAPSGTQVADTFQRPNGSLGPNWTVTAGAWSISNSQATFVGDGGNDDSALAVYGGSTFANNQSATAQIMLNSSGTTAAGVGVRMSASAKTGYVCFAGLRITMILKYDSGVRSGLGVEGPAFPSGDYLTAQVTGSSPPTISCLDNGVPIVGLTVTDSSSPLTSGYPGIFGEYNYSSLIGNFSAKNLAYATNSLIAFGAGLRTVPEAFSALSPCSSTIEGTTQAVIDSNTKNLGATITGGNGPYHVLAYCDGGNWIVGIGAQ